MTVMSSLAEAIHQASGSFSGQLVQPADAGYDVWRRVHNGLIDKHLAAIARCHGVADVVDAVKLARTLDLEVAVRGGGQARGLHSGGRFFPDPTSAYVDGASSGGSCLRVGWIGIGRLMEIHSGGRHIMTSPVLAVTTEQPSRLNVH
jgi:hypothetical protein